MGIANNASGSADGFDVSLLVGTFCDDARAVIVSADAPGSFLIWVSKRFTSYAMEMPGKRFDVGDIASYEQVRREYRGIEICGIPM